MLKNKHKNININEIRKQIVDMFYINKVLLELNIENSYLTDKIKYINKNYDLINSVDYLDEFVLYDIIEKIHLYFSSLKILINKDYSDSDDIDIVSIKRRINNYSNNMFVFEKIKDNECVICGIKYIHVNKQYACPNCNVVKERTIKVKENNDGKEEVKQVKSNIGKHYIEIMQKIYGVKPKGRVLPNEVIKLMKIRLESSGIYINQSAHYIYTLMEKMSKMGRIEYNGNGYIIKKYKNQANYILKIMYPELVIPDLTIGEEQILLEVFMNISAVFQQLNPGKYAINYAFNIFRTLYMKMPESIRAKELMRFIYIQKANSFPDKDKKLKEVNDRIKVFDPFIYTPSDIYYNKKYYKRNW